MKTALIGLLSAAATMGSISTAAAHTVWLVPKGSAGDYTVMFGGHDDKAESFPAEKLKEVEAFDSKGAKLKVTRQATAEGASIHVAGKPVLITAHYDNGIYSTTPDGRSVNQPMDRTPGAKKAVDAVKYHKTIVEWSPMVIRRMRQPFEVVPVSSTPPRAGQMLKVQVLIDGKPAPGLKLGRGEDKLMGEVTDANGVTSFPVQPGFNKLWAGKRIATAGNPRFTELSYEYLLGFTAQ